MKPQCGVPIHCYSQHLPSTVQAFRRLANQRGKKFRIFYDDTPVDDDDGPTSSDMRAALERSARSTSSRAGSASSSNNQVVDPAVRTFFHSGSLDYCLRIAPGFYACFGEFPEVADKGELPALPLLRQCVVVEGREVITVDPNTDQGLRTFLDVKIIEAVTRQGTMDTRLRIAAVVRLIAVRLGGASPDHALAARYSQYSHSMQLGQQSVVLPLGMLTVRPPVPSMSAYRPHTVTQHPPSPPSPSHTLCAMWADATASG